MKVTRGSESSVMPEVGSIVTCRVLGVNPAQASMSILAVGEQMLHTPFQGTLKKPNVRQHQIDAVEMYNCYRPFDIVLGKVLSLGGTRSYEISTAANELGVVTARCEEGHALVPDSWTTMKCVCRTEKRKVAKVVPPQTVPMET
ncbi:UNVERIFIED_CONTAM: hypothetical protein GTU68_013034 [Idotea baltica]|nr:hypothetical protein [Idotea baltica]